MEKDFELDLAKGFRDFSPAEKILRDYVIAKIKNVFEIYAFSPLETPTVERLDILEAKFGAGEASDAISEIYRFKDQGDRDLGLRYEFTFALARYIGMNPQTRLPFKRYQIGPVFRDGPIKAGRYREFYQCDVDTVGASGMIADAEILALVSDVFKELKLDVNIEVSSRKLLSDILSFVEIPEDYQTTTIITIDKLKKVGRVGVTKELLEKEISEDKINKILDILLVKGNNQEKLNNIKKVIGETDGIKELTELFNYLNKFNTEYVFLPSLARGLGYYTGPIFEVFLKEESILPVSIAGGGRWDKMIGKYLKDENRVYPAVGVAFGLEPIMEIIKARDGMVKETTADLYIIPIKTEKQAIEITQTLRSQGIKTMVDLLGRAIGKNMDFANKSEIPFVGLLGEDEVKQNKIKIKNMKSGEEVLVDIDKVKDILK
ncbi:MAG: histidine--tRNA ligase [archaeon]